MGGIFNPKISTLQIYSSVFWDIHGVLFVSRLPFRNVLLELQQIQKCSDL